MQTFRELDVKTCSQRTLCLFAHFDGNGVIDPYVVYHLEALHQLGMAVLFVSASPLSQEAVDTIRMFCAGVYSNVTPSLDFGSWHTAWCLLQEYGSLNRFDRLVLVNDSVYGPLFPLEDMWNSFHSADMYGAIESTEHMPHLQSWFLAWDLNPKTRLFLNKFWSGFRHVRNKGELIWRYEIGLSMRARNAGLTIKPFVSAAAAEKSAGSCPNKTIEWWDGLIEEFRFPYVKRLVALRQPRRLADAIRATGYPFELIECHRDRLLSAR